MKKGLTELVFILDASGSMYDLTEDTIGGFNSLLAKQKKGEGEALVSLVTFNTVHKVVYDRVDIKEIKPLTEKDYQADGCTALIDAIGRAVHHITNVHKYIREEDVPEHTLFVITTDGLENSSRQYCDIQVKEMIQSRKEQGWEFLFLAANIDAVETAKDIGIHPNRAVDFHADYDGIDTVCYSLNKVVSKVRACEEIEDDWADDIKADYQRRK